MLAADSASRCRPSSAEHAAEERRGGDGHGGAAAVRAARPAIDVTVSSLGNAKSLRGGTLLMTPLQGRRRPGLRAWRRATCSSAAPARAANGSKVQVNQLAVGPHPRRRDRRARGAERRSTQAAARCSSNCNDMRLRHRRSKVVAAINNQFGSGTALALDGRTIQVRAPADPTQRVVVHGAAREPRRAAVAGRGQGDHQRAHRLDRDEPDGHAAELRGRARQPVGRHQHADGGQPARRVLERRRRWRRSSRRSR